MELKGSGQDLVEVERFHLKMKSTDSTQLVDQLQYLKQGLENRGYLSTAIGWHWRDSIHLVAEIELGPQFLLASLDPGNVDPGLLRRTGYKSRHYTNRPFSPLQLDNLIQHIIRASGNSGYPFASVKLDSVKMTGNQVRARLNFDAGPLITFDSLKLSTTARVKTRFLQAYLRMPVGSPYSESLVEDIPGKISGLPYLELEQLPGVSFQNDQATTHLQLSAVRVNEVEGVIGFLPNAATDGGLILTGQFNLLLHNMFGSGRRLGFQWESFKPESQQLNIGIYQPMLLRSPIDLDLEFSLFKEDSTFLNRHFNLNMEYSYQKRHRIGLTTQLKASRLPSSQYLEGATTFPDLADFNLNQFGGTYRYENLDHIIQPRRGFRMALSAATGMKKIRKNTSISDSLYTDLDLQSTQFTWEAALEGYIPVARRWVVAASWHGAGVYNDRLFFNDLFRLGGLNSIRGFSENTFFADNYAYTRLEPRFFFETNSYLFAFYDQAWWLSYDLENNQFNDTPSGLGAGISLTTKAGIFSFVWAVGKSKVQEIGVGQSKIHFGYISRF